MFPNIYLVKIRIRERPITFNPTQKAKYVPIHKIWKDLEKSQEILSLDSTMYIPILPKHYTYLSSNSRIFMPLQVNLFQKLSFLNQLTHNMMRDCSLNSPKKYKFRTCCGQNFCFCFGIQNNICTQHVLSLYFLGIQLTISHHIVG